LPDGLRRYYPATGLDLFLAQAFAAGLALLDAIFGLTPDQRLSYRAMYLLFQRVRQTREHLGNALLNATSLRLYRVGRDTEDVRTILPEPAGLNRLAQGSPWGVDRLLQEGRHAAHAAGVFRPTEADCVHRGLVAAAELNPLEATDGEVAPLVRMALYES